MKKILLTLLMLLAGTFAFNQTPDSWTQKKNFQGAARYDAVGFSIGSKGYIGTGYIFFGGGFGGSKDFWEYDPVTNTWAQKADFGGGVRVGAIGFSINSKGFIGTGTGSGTSGDQKDFWEYDPAANAWTRKADFGGSSRNGAVGFSIGNKGYLGIGNSNITFFKDFWEYNPATDTWMQKADFVGRPRWRALGFSINDKGYIGTGTTSALNGSNEFWEYDPVSNKWQKKADFGGTARTQAAGFSTGKRGYIGIGNSYDSTIHYNQDFWEYDPLSNTWIQKADFGGVGRSWGVGFSINDRGYIGTGTTDASNAYNDFWEYTPSNDTIVNGCQPPSVLKVPFISDTTALLKWTPGVGSVSGYNIRYHIVSSSTIIRRHKTGSSSHIVLMGLLPNTTYEWQIRSDCVTDTSGWVYGPDFTTLSSVGFLSNTASINGNKVQGNVSMQIMPNPNKGNFTLQMQLSAKAASATLSLYNSLGVKVWQQDAGILSGSVSKNIALENRLSAGVYVLMIQQGDTRLMQKVVVTK